MPNILNPNNTIFPPVENADEHGIVAYGGDFSSERLLQAYRLGIFPWPHDNLPILWFCPEPRFVIEPNKINMSRSLAKAIRKCPFTFVADKNFSAVMKNCQKIQRKDQSGTWIRDDMLKGYQELFDQEYAHCIEAYQNDQLVGGLYGIAIGKIFFGESMFHLESNVSKICFAILCAQLSAWDFDLIDCQAPTNLFKSFGAQSISRKTFLQKLNLAITKTPLKSRWQFQGRAQSFFKDL